MAVPCTNCGGIAYTFSSQMLSDKVKKSWVECRHCRRITTRLDEEAAVLFEGIPADSIDKVPPNMLKLRGRNAGILKRAMHMAINQLELPV